MTKDVICIDPGVVVDVVFMDGGTLCNEGTVSDLKLNGGSGIVNNYSNIENYEGSFKLKNNLEIHNFPYATFVFYNNQSIDLDSRDFSFTNYNGANFSFDNYDMNVYTGTITIINGETWSVDPGISDQALFNLAHHFNSDDNGVVILNKETGYFNVNGSINLNGVANKSIGNSGLMEVLGSFNTGGTASSNVIELQNSGSMAIYTDFNSTVSNASLSIINQNSIIVYNDFILTNPSSTVTNSSQFIVNNNVDLNYCNFTNNEYITCNNINLNNSIYHNNNNSYFNYLNNVNSVFNNNSYINASTIVNTGTINLAEKTLILTYEYSNTNGIIHGPSGVTDTLSYARIIITNSSTNSTWIDGNILVHDKSLNCNSTNINYGFDNVTNASKIAGTVFFASKSVGPGSPPVSTCATLNQLYNVSATKSTSSAMCQGGLVVLTSQLNQVITYTVPFWGLVVTLNYPLTIPSNSFTWTPGNMVGYQHVVSPSSTTTYTVKINYFGCTFTNVVTVTVTPNAVSITANQTGILCYPSSGLILNGTASAPGAYTLQWYLNGSPISGATSLNYTPTGPGIYYLKMTATGSCPAASSNTITIHPKPSVTIVASALGICQGVPVTFTATVASGSGSGFSYQWTQNTTNVGTNSNMYTTSSAGNYAVNVTNSNGCVGTSNAINIQVSTGLTANAGPDQIYLSTPIVIGGVNAGSSACATGGVPPYTPLWSTNSGFISGNVNQCNNLVVPTVSTIYSLTVTDAAGCQSTDNVFVAKGGTFYIVPKKDIDGGYQVPVANKVYFKFEEEYKNGNLSYKILDYNSLTANIQPANIVCSLVPSAKSLGDNRYYIDITTCSLQTSKFYLVEVTTDKNEKFYFKFLN
jgi:hypothetical protein